MKKMRRIEIQIERRELSIFGAALSVATADGTERTIQKDELARSKLSDKLPERCPTCDSTEMLLLADAIALATRSSVNRSEPVVLPDCHLHCSGSNEWWVCKPSLHLD